MDDHHDLAWCREVYFDPTSTDAQVRAAWNCAMVLVADRLKNGTVEKWVSAMCAKARR